MEPSIPKLKVGIVGVSGYGGGELARLLLAHPHVQLTYVTSGTYAGKPLQAALPGAVPPVLLSPKPRSGWDSSRDDVSSLICEVFDPVKCAGQCDFVFLAGESGLAMKIAPGLLEAGLKVVDLSADFRLKDPAVYKEWYHAEHTAPELLKEAVYGLPELEGCWSMRPMKDTRLVANPGCYPTSAILALDPLLNVEVVSADQIFRDTIVIDSLSGISGAGRSKFGLDYHFSEVNESARAYGVGGVHRHTPEIEQALSGIDDLKVTFTPHLIPITRGILTTVTATLDPEYSAGFPGEDEQERLVRGFRAHYRYHPFVVVLDPGQFPATKHVYGTNFCHIGVGVDKRTNRVIVVSAIDNLVKGAAGQAIQNMNLMCGFEETAGLTMGAVWP